MVAIVEDRDLPGAFPERTGGHRLALVLLLTAVMAGLVLGHVYGINGPWYWKWSWRRLPAWPLYASMLVAAAVPFGLSQWAWLRAHRRKLAVALLAVTTLSLELTALAHQPPTALRRLPAIVQNPVNTSYYTDAYILDVRVPVRDLWKWTLESLGMFQSKLEAAWGEPLRVILQHGPLARRIVRALHGDTSRAKLAHVYDELCDCLAQGRMFNGHD